MMSYLYPEDEVAFDKSGFGPLPDMLESYAEEEANSYFELYFEYPLISSHERGDYDQVYVNMSDYLIEGNQVTYKPSHSREPHAFRIYKTEKQVERGIILVWARTRTADLRGNPVRRVVSNGAPVSSALSALKMASEETHPFSFTTNIQSNVSFEKYQTNVLDALAGEEDSILAITGGQMIRTNNNVYIGINESSKNIVEFRLGKNIEGISYEVDYSNVVTAVIPFYTQTYKLVDDVRDEIVRDNAGGIVKNPDGSTKYVRTVGKKRESLDDEVIVYGDTVFSQYANDYSTPFYIFYEIRDDREDKDPLPPFTKADINNRAVDWFEWEENLGIDEPEVYVTVNIHDISQSSEYSHNVNLSKLETLNVFDKALVYVPEVGIDMDMEINYIRYDGVAEKNIEVRLGNAITSLRETMISPQQRDFNQKVQKLDHEIAKTSLSSDGKARIYWMATKPVGEFEIGDLWFDVSLDGGIYVWDGYDWVAKITSDFGQLVEDSVNAAIDAAEEAKELAISEADNVLAQAKADATTKANAIKEQITGEVNTAITTAEDAKALAVSEAENALAQAKADATAKDNAIKEQIGKEVNSAIETAEDAKALAVSEAESALSQAKADATAKANAVKEEVGNSVNTAIDTANDAKQTAVNNYTNAVAEAKRLDGEQKIAFDKKFDDIEDSVDTFNRSVSDVDAKANEALEKAGANADLLTTHQNTIDTIDTVTLPDINSSVGDALANAKSAMDEAKKADEKIADYVTKNGLVSGTTVDTKIDEATGAISKKITTVEGKIPTEIGGRNYAHQSNTYYFTTDYKIAEYNLSRILKGTKIKISIWGGLDSGVRTFGIYVNNASGLVSDNSQKFELTKLSGLHGQGRSTSLSKWTGEVTLDVDATKILVFGFDNNSTTPKRIEYVKVETGGLFTDWTAAPEDNYTQEEFKIFESTYDEDVRGINSSLSSLSNDKLDGSTYTTFYKEEYEKTAEGVKDTYTKLEKVVDENGNTTDTFAKAVYDQNATRRTEDFDEVTKDLVKEATYTAGVNGLSGSISTISGRLDNLTVGGRNYALKSNEYYYTTDYKVAEYDLAKILKGTKIKISIWGALGTNVRTFRVYINNGNGTASGNSQIIELTKLSGTYGQGRSAALSKWTAEATLDVDADKILVFGADNNTTSPKRIEYVKVETGGAFTDWTVAPEDMLGKEVFQVFKTTYEANDKLIKARLLAVDSGKEGSIAYRLNETEKTASGNTTTISDIKTKPGEQITGYQTIKERSDLYERVIGTDEAGIKSNMARMVMTDSLFKTEVIKNVPSAIGGRNYVLKSDDYYYTTNYKVAEYDLSTLPKGTKVKISIWGALGSNARTFGIYVNNASGTTSGNSQKIELTKLDGTYGMGRSAGLSKWTTEVTLNVDATKILVYGFDNNSTSPKRIEYVQIETGDYYTDWTAAPEDKASMSAITQLENSIDLKVSDSELLSRINVQAGGILITSGTNKLNITPTTTYIEDATIKSAMIDSIDVKQIKGINADFTSMVTKALTADTITATMIKANDSMFEKLFANKFATNKLAAQGAWIKDANIISLDASTITSGTIDSGRIDAEYIVTNGLSTNVIKSEHINATVALVNKIFSEEAYVNALTSKSIFTEKIKAIEIDAGKITSGTIDSALIDAEYIVTNGLSTNVIKSEHVNATVALVNKIFSEEAYIKALTSKSIFANQIKAIEIDASKIKTGTIDSALIDAGYIVANGLTTDAIQAKHIKAETGLIDKIFSEDAYIEELTNKVMFTESVQAISISASKITTGELDASKVSVVNIDANKITANKTDFVKSSWNAINSNLSVSGSELKYTHADGSYTRMNANGIQTVVGGSAYQHNYLTHVKNVTINSGSDGNVQWVDLPSVFKGKDFTYFMGATDIYGAITETDYFNNKMVLKRFVLIKHPDYNVDYANARIPILGYAHYVNIDSRKAYFRALQGIVFAQY